MLGFIFRGVFLIGILTWYSTHVWKLIDTYFKDQFRSYLEEEYRRNPRMRSDVSGFADKANPSVIATTTAAPLERLLESCQEDVCPVGEAGNDTDNPPTLEISSEPVIGELGQNSTDETIDKVAFQVAEGSGPEGGISNETQVPSQVVEVTTEKSPEEIQRESEVETSTEKEKKPSEPTSTTTETPTKRPKLVKKPPVVTEAPRKPRKRRVKTLMFTEEDFASVKRDEGDDFWEFEEDGTKEHVAGVLVSQLPLKPRLELGELDRVDPDEFCSLGLEEDDCERTYKWP